MLYTYTDNQGSLLALTDASGTVLEKYAYDPWGARRNPTDWTLKDTRTKWITNRGYAGHEHLDAFGIINMNGRVYDPLTAQFFSPDPFIQAPDNWLNYNRYGYCMNNPLKYTDPLGYYFDKNTRIWIDDYQDTFNPLLNVDANYIEQQSSKYSIMMNEVVVSAPKLESFNDRMNSWMDKLGYGTHPYDNQKSTGNASVGEKDENWRYNLVNGTSKLNDIAQAIGRGLRNVTTVGATKIAGPLINTFKLGIAVEKDSGLGRNSSIEIVKIAVSLPASYGGVMLGTYIGGCIGGGIGFALGGINAIPGVFIGQAVGAAIGGYFATSYSSDLVDAVANKIK